MDKSRVAAWTICHTEVTLPSCFRHLQLRSPPIALHRRCGSSLPYTKPNIQPAMAEENDTFDIDSSLAASLGFSSFGAQPSSKRRKYVHNDAVVAAPPGAPPARSASGGNAIPVGERRVKGESLAGEGRALSLL